MYKVFRISENSNSFGLKQFYAVDKNGNVFRACANYLSLPKMGQMVEGPKMRGVELVERLDDVMPKGLVKEIFQGSEKKMNRAQ